MTTPGVAPAVAAFIREQINSIELLEVLLLFHASEPGRAWSPEAVAAELRIQPRSVEQRCAALMRIGLLIPTGQEFRYNPESPMAATIDELAKTYKTYRVAIIEMIFSKPVDSSRLFADAFVLRKSERGGGDG